jgi:hypothetical protein
MLRKKEEFLSPIGLQHSISGKKIQTTLAVTTSIVILPSYSVTFRDFVHNLVVTTLVVILQPRATKVATTTHF